MKKNYRDLFSFKWKLMAKRMTFLAVIAVFVCGTYAPLYALSPGEPATQLLKDRGLLVLRDSFKKIGTLCSANPKSHLTVFNKTMKTLTIELTGKNGTYPLILRPKTEHSWRISPGIYHFEAGIPGFPTMAGEIPLCAQTQFTWQIWRGELENSPNIPYPVPVISNQPPVISIKKQIESETVDSDEPLITNR